MTTTMTVRDVMTDLLTTCPPDASIADAARLMRDHEIGDVLVVDDDRLCGIVTDRDLVVRCLADGDADSTVRQACSPDPITLTPDSTVEDAVHLMRDHALRRVPVVEAERLVGIVTLGDLAVERDPQSALGTISAAPANS